MADINLNAVFEQCATGEPTTPDFRASADAVLRQQQGLREAMQQVIDIYGPGGPGESRAREHLGDGYDEYIQGTRDQVQGIGEGVQVIDECINPKVANNPTPQSGL